MYKMFLIPLKSEVLSVKRYLNTKKINFIIKNFKKICMAL